MPMPKNKYDKMMRYCEKINRECLWEFNFDNDEILKMAQTGTEQEKKFLFNKILENSSDVLQCINIFNASDQRKLTLDFKVPEFNHRFLDRRHKIIKYFITGEPVEIPELRWNI